MKNYKVYTIKERLTASIVYVGMTSMTLNKRFNDHVRRRQITPKDYYIELIQDFLTLEQAVTLEELLITQYETRVTGWNKAPKTSSGYCHPHSDEQKERWINEREQKGFCGKRYQRKKGEVVSDSHLKSLIDAGKEKSGRPTKRKVICLNNGVVYESMKEASQKLGLCHQKVSLTARGLRPHTRGYRFSFIASL